MATNVGISIWTEIPQDGIIEVELANLNDVGADIVSIEIQGGGVLHGVRIIENGQAIEPSEVGWFTAIWISSSPGDLVEVKHLSGSAAVGEKIDTVLGVDAIIDQHDFIGRYSWDPISEQWRLKLNCWSAA